MANTWVLVADSSRAKVFEAKSAIGELEEVAAFEHPEAREHNYELTSDLPGRTGHNSMDRKFTPKDHEAEQFAKELCRHLDLGASTRSFEHLVLVAPPAFLGRLRTGLSEPTRKRVTAELNKDLTQLDVSEIRTHLPDRL